MFGVNLYPIDPEVSRAQNLRHMGFEISEINRRIASAAQPSTTADDRQEIRDEYMALIKRRMEQMAKYAAESKVHEPAESAIATSADLPAGGRYSIWIRSS